MEIHVAVAVLPDAVQVVAERTSQGLYLVIHDGMTQTRTAAAVAEVVCNALTNEPEP